MLAHDPLKVFNWFAIRSLTGTKQNKTHTFYSQTYVPAGTMLLSVNFQRLGIAIHSPLSGLNSIARNLVRHFGVCHKCLRYRYLLPRTISFMYKFKHLCLFRITTQIPKFTNNHNIMNSDVSLFVILIVLNLCQGIVLSIVLWPTP